MTKLVWGLLVSLSVVSFFPVEVRAEVPEKRLTPEMQKMKEQHPGLFNLHEDAAKDLEGMVMAPLVVPDAEKRRELAAWRKASRPPEELKEIVESLLNAYAADPPDWPVVELALSAARKGAPDPRVLKVARDLVRSTAQLPEEGLYTVGAAAAILALSGEAEDIELLKKATSREFVGIKLAPGETGFVGGPRELICQQALVALFMYAPLDEALSAMREVVESYKAAAPGFDTFMKGSADGFLAQLEKVKKGEKVKLPSPN